MIVREAQARDASAVARGEWATAETPGMLVGRPGEIPETAYAEKIADLAAAGSYWVAEEAGTVIGHAFLEPMGMTGNSHVFGLNIVVYPAHTNRGVGTALMATLMAWADAHPGLERIELFVRATNVRAIALYRKFGFAEEGCLSRRVRTPDGTFIDDLVMAWTRPVTGG